MQILSKTIEIPAKYPVDNKYIEQELLKIGITPLRWAIVKVDCDKLEISVSYENL